MTATVTATATTTKCTAVRIFCNRWMSGNQREVKCREFATLECYIEIRMFSSVWVPLANIIEVTHSLWLSQTPISFQNCFHFYSYAFTCIVYRLMFDFITDPQNCLIRKQFVGKPCRRKWHSARRYNSNTCQRLCWATPFTVFSSLFLLFHLAKTRKTKLFGTP